MICRHCDADVPRDDLPGHLVDEHHLRVCALCARRGRATEVDMGVVCRPCVVRIEDRLDDILRLAADAAAYIEPLQNGHYVRSVPTSRPPLNVDSIEPAMILVKPWAGDPDDLDKAEEVPLLMLLESWERIIRSERGMAAYGPVSAERTARNRRSTAIWQSDTLADAADLGMTERLVDHAFAAQNAEQPGYATLVGVVNFLRSQLDWITSRPSFGLDHFADEVDSCWRALLRYDAEREGALTWRIECPADINGRTCGKGLRIAGDDLDRDVTCPSCRTRWDVHRLLLVAADTTDAHMWLDADAITARTGVDRKTLDRWVREGRVEKSHGRYDARPILAGQRRLGA